MGPLASQRRLQAVEELVQDAVARGAEVATGGQRLGDEGWFYAPTVLTGVPHAARVMNEEPFGPIAPVVSFRELDEEQGKIAREVLLALVVEGEDGGVERRRVPLAELEVEHRADVVSVLADRRLLTLSDGAVEPAHESLLREWPRLRSWIEEDRARIRINRSLQAAAQEWVPTVSSGCRAERPATSRASGAGLRP